MYKIIGADGKEYGPVTAEQLKQWIADGRANAQTVVQAEGSSDWKPLSLFPEFSQIFGSLASKPPMAAGQVAASGAPNLNVPNYLVQAILCTLCCCVPLGIVAIVYAAQVNSKVAIGDINGAWESSNKAKKWCWVALICGLIANLIIIGINIAAGVLQGMGQ